MSTKRGAKPPRAEGLNAQSTATLVSMLMEESERDPHAETFILKLSQSVPLPEVATQIMRLRKYAKSRRGK